MLRLPAPAQLVLTFAADQSEPVAVLVEGRRAGATPGRGGPAQITVQAPAGRVELTLRSTHRRGGRPAPLFVVLASVAVA